MRGYIRLGAITSAAFALLTGATGIRADVEPGSAATPVLYTSIQALTPMGLSAGEAAASWDLSATTIARNVVGAGNEQYSSLCAISSGGPDFQPGTRVGWVVEGRLLSVDADGARVGIRWTRKVLDTTLGVPDFVREFETRLHEGTRSVIDFLRPEKDDPDCDGVVISLWMEFRDPADLAREVLDYDVWLIHHDAAGREVVEQSRGRTLQGQSLDFLFRRQHYSTDGRISPHGAVSADYSGSVRGRVRKDGRIDLSLYAHRMFMERSLGQGETGNTQATIADGETLEFQVPPTQSRDDGFKAHRTSIRVTVRRVT